jgi:hypothetical protein
MDNSVTRVSDDAVHVFCRDLKQLHLKIGEPKFAGLEKLADELKAAGHITRHLPKSTINDIVLGKRVRLPEWEWVCSYVHVCRVYAERNVPAVKDLPGEEYWHMRWYRTKRASLDTAPWPVAGSSDSEDGREDFPDRPRRPGREVAPPIDGRTQVGTDVLAGPGLSWNARRYFTLFGDHGIALLDAAQQQYSLDADERQHGLEACCQLGMLLTCVGWVQEAEVWLSFSVRDTTNPIPVTLLYTPRVNRGPGPNRLQLAAEFLYDMAVAEVYQRRKTGETRPAPWIDLYLTIAARYGRHKDAAYHLAIRNRAYGHDDDAAYWFAFADRLGHRAAPDRFEAIYQEIRVENGVEEWLEGKGPVDGEG